MGAMVVVKFFISMLLMYQTALAVDKVETKKPGSPEEQEKPKERPKPRVIINFTNINFNGVVELYSVDPDASFDEQETKIVALGEKGPLIKKMTNTFFMSNPGTKNMAMVVDNNSDKDLFFFANIHNVKPPEAAVGTKFTCLCSNHVYRVPAKKRWYRLVRLSIIPTFNSPSVTMDHQIIGLTAEEVNKKGLQSAVYEEGGINLEQ